MRNWRERDFAGLFGGMRMNRMSLTGNLRQGKCEAELTSGSFFNASCRN